MLAVVRSAAQASWLRHKSSGIGAPRPMFEPGAAFADSLDRQDPLRHFRDQFAMPVPRNRSETTYLDGDSLGLQPQTARDRVIIELDKWAHDGALAHFETEQPWVEYHQYLAQPVSRIVGALPSEVIAMNTLTVNLHLMMVSFYRPSASRYKILVEDHAFPSDHYAVESQIRAHGLDPAEALITVTPRPKESTASAGIVRPPVAARQHRRGQYHAVKSSDDSTWNVEEPEIDRPR